jgi:hypothetical protein
MMQPSAVRTGHHTDPAATYRRWAVLLLAATVVVGAWMRALFVWPRLGLGLSFPNLIHAHSHVAFFGWIVMGMGAVLAARRSHSGTTAERRRASLPRALRLHAHALGVASVAALLAFAAQGYGAASIAISIVHVLLWVALAALAWPLEGATPAERALLRGALVFLLVAGATTVIPGILMARGVESGWVRELGIKLFVTTFIHGWVGLGAMGIVYGRIERSRLLPPRIAHTAGWLVALGTLPATLLYVSSPAPAAWLVTVGRTGAGLVGLGTILFALDALVARRRATLPVLLEGAAIAALAAGVLGILAAAGVGTALMHGRPVVLAWVHLVLLGVATPAILSALHPSLRAHRWVAAYGAGLALMLVALAAMGWPRLAALLAAVGVDVMRTLDLALYGGVAAAAALLAIVARAAAAERRAARDAGAAAATGGPPPTSSSRRGPEDAPSNGGAGHRGDAPAPADRAPAEDLTADLVSR